MEKNTLPSKALLTSWRNLSNTYVACIHYTKGCTIKQAVDEGICDVINYDFSNVHVVDKEKIKEQTLVNNNVLLYLDIDLKEVPSDRIIKPPSCKTTTSVPFICVGWSDYEYLNSYTKQGKKIKNRGYLMLCPIEKPIIKENIYYLPYKFVKSNDEHNLVREVWYFNDINETVIPARSRIEMNIGDNIFKYDGHHYETDAPPYYHLQGNPMVPLRTIAERFGYTVTWKRRTKTITISKNDTEITLKVGDKKCFINGVETTMFLPVHINKTNKRSYVTLGFIRNIFDCDAEFIKETELIKIYKN